MGVEHKGALNESCHHFFLSGFLKIYILSLPIFHFPFNTFNSLPDGNNEWVSLVD